MYKIVRPTLATCLHCQSPVPWALDRVMLLTVGIGVAAGIAARLVDGLQQADDFENIKRLNEHICKPETLSIERASVQCCCIPIYTFMEIFDV